MTLPRPTTLLLLCSAALILGCQPAVQTRAYDISVANRLSEPITVYLTKTGLPDERGWLSPEQLASLPITQDSPGNGKVILPGERIRNPNLIGHFEVNASAVLRVYRTVGTLEDLSALSPGNPRRLDIILHPGVNNLFIYADDSGLVVQRDDP